MKRNLTIITIITCLIIMLGGSLLESRQPRLSTAALQNLIDKGIKQPLSTAVMNRLNEITASPPFSTAHIKEIEAYFSADLFLPNQRTAGNLDTPLGTEVLVDGEFAVQVANVLTNWTRVGMTEDSYSTVAPYSGISHAIVIDDNAAGEEYLNQGAVLQANTPYRLSVWVRSASGTPTSRLYFRNFNDDLTDNGDPARDQTANTVYTLQIKHNKTVSDLNGDIGIGGTSGGTGTFYFDLASLRPIILAAFPNYTFNSAGSTTGDQFGSYVMAKSDGGILIYKGPLAGAARINNIDYTKTLSGLTIGKVYTVVFTAKSDGVGTGKVLVTNDLMLNGGFETAGAGGADVFANWTETTAGTSSINQDASVFFSGAASDRHDIDASNNSATLSQAISATNAQQYRIRYATKSSASGKSCKLGLSTETPTRYWNFTSEAWQTDAVFLSSSLTVWQVFDRVLTAEATKNITIVLARDTAASASFWFDEASFEHILGSSSIAATDTAETKKSFTFTATATSHKLILQSSTPNGAVTFKGVSVR